MMNSQSVRSYFSRRDVHENNESNFRRSVNESPFRRSITAIPCHLAEDDGSISSKSSYPSTAFQSAAMELTTEDEDSVGSDEDQEPVSRTGCLPEAPEGNGMELDMEHMKKRDERFAAAMMRNSQPNEQDRELMDLFETPSWRREDTMGSLTEDEEMGNTSFIDDNTTVASEAQPRGSKYLNRLSVGPVTKGMLGLVAALLVVLPFTFAMQAKQDKSNDGLNGNSTNATTTLTNNNDVQLPEEEVSLALDIDREVPTSAVFSPTPTVAPTTRDRLQSILPTYTLTAAAEPNTPQYQAYKWLMQDPLLDDYDDWEIEQRMAMATFYHAFDGPQWVPPVKLQYNVPACEWFPDGTTCHSNGTLAGLRIDTVSGFRGSMPAEIGWLTRLEEIHFGNLELFNLPLTNLLTPNLRELTALKSFECINCQLLDEGAIPEPGSTIPTTIGEVMPNLQHLDLFNSQLTAIIPTELGLLTHLTSLNLNQNYLAAALPSELGMLSLLNLLWLNQNKLRGPMPTDLWEQWTAMKDIDLSSNELTGSIPSTIGKMSNLQHLDVKGGNRFAGSLPSQLGLLSSLSALKLGGNRIGGSLPFQIRNLNKLVTLGLLGNLLTGTIPWFSALKDLVNLSQLSLGQNNFTGTLPPYALSFFGNHTKLSLMDISSNHLDGAIPLEVGSLASLTSLSLNDNNFQGKLPRELSQLTDLQTFNVAGNVALKKEVPREMCDVAEFDFDDFHFGWCEGRAECCY